MQHSPHEITEKLLKALDKDYNVVDVPVVVEIIGILERTPITKEALETTRLGKYVNELRRKTTNEQVAKRAKDLVRKWRYLIRPQNNAGGEGGAGSSQNGARPAVSSGRIVSPAVGRSISPGSWNKSGPVSPALSLKRSQPSSPASRISSLSPDNRVNLSPNSQRQVTISSNLSPRPQMTISKLNQSVQLPRPSGESSGGNVAPVGGGIPKAADQAPAPVVNAPRPRGRPPLNRSALDVVKSPPRPRGRPPLEPAADGEPPRGRGRPPLDPSRAEHRGRGRPPLSSPPSGPPRGRGRPPKNKNKLKKLASSPESNQNNNLVPKNSPANKRLRKPSEDEDESVSSSKKLKPNGVYDCKVPDLVSANEESAVSDPSQVPSEQIKVQKKRGRKKGSKNAPKTFPFDRNEEDVVKEKMASIVRNPKVKTTRELLECIQKESSLDNLRNKTLSSLGVDGDGKPGKNSAPSPKFLNKNEVSDYEMTISKSEHIHKFLRSQKEAEDDFEPRTSAPAAIVPDHRSATKIPIVGGGGGGGTDTEKSESRPHSRISDNISSAKVSESSLSHDNLDPVEEDVIDVEKIDDSAEDSPAKPAAAAAAAAATATKVPETVEEILAKLPAINPDEILWSETESSGGESDAEGRDAVVTDYDVDCLHNSHIEGVNGNWNEGELVAGLNHGLRVPVGEASRATAAPDVEEKPNEKPNTEETDEEVGDETEHLDRNLNNLDVNNKSHDDNFREWQECVSKKSYNGELLHILPYVIID